jgi:protein-disulfide isomerase
VSDASKKARRDQAREHAREMREIARKRKARNRWILMGGGAVVLIAAAVSIVLVVTSINNAAIEEAKPKPGPANMISDGIILTGNPAGSGEIVAVPTAAIPAGGVPTPTNPADYPNQQVHIVTYIDYFCPFCQAFEQTNAEQLSTWVSAGAATLEIHPIAILDGSSMGTRYATRAANAMACVANFQPDIFFQVTSAMYAAQPAEATEGLTNDQIMATITSAGVTEPKIATCVENETFRKWVKEATDRTGQPLPNSDVPQLGGTPTVIVDGILYTGAVDDATAFATFVTSIATGTYVAPTP